MHCRTARKLLSSRLDGRLAPPAGAALGAHLARCPDCALASEALERAWKSLGAIGAVANAPDDFAAVLRAAEIVRAGWRGRIAEHLARAPGLLRPAAALAVAASLVVGATGGARLGRAAFAKRGRDAPAEAVALSEGFGVLPFGSPAAGLAHALGGGTEGRK